MITEKQSSLAAGILSDIKNAYGENAVLIPVMGSPLSEACYTLKSPLATTQSLIVKLSETVNNYSGLHGDVVSEAGNIAANIIGASLDIGRNKLNSVCSMFLAEIEKQILSNRLQASGIDYDIKMVECPSIYSEQLFLDLIEPYKNLKTENFGGNLNTLIVSISETISNDDFKQGIKTNLPKIDDKVNLIASSEKIESAKADIGVLVELMAFKNLDSVGDKTTLLYNMGVDPAKTIIYYLFFNNILNGNIEKLNYLTEDNTTKSALIRIRDFLGKVTNQNSVKINMFFNGAFGNKNIIVSKQLASFTQISVKRESTDIYVNGPLYRDWINVEKGGVGNDGTLAVLGYNYLANVKGVSTSKSLVDDAEYFKRIYNVRVKEFEAQNSFGEENIIKRTAYNLVKDWINEISGGNEKLIKLRFTIVNGLMKEFVKIPNLHEFVIKIVCRVYALPEMLEYGISDIPDVEYIMLSFNSELNANPNANKVEILQRCTLKLIAKWLVGQLTLQLGDPNGRI